MKKLLIIEGNTDKDSLNIQKFKGLSYVPLFTKSIEIIGEYQIDALYPTRNDFEQISMMGFYGRVLDLVLMKHPI